MGRSSESGTSREELECEPPIRGQPEAGRFARDGDADWPRKVRIAIGTIAIGALLAVIFVALNTALAVLSGVRGQHALSKARALADSGAFAAAIPVYDAALRERLSANSRALAYGWRGWAYTKVGRDGDAIRDFSAALQIEPNLVFALLDRGLAFHRAGKFAEAMVDYDRTIVLNRNSVDAYRNRALILAHRGRAKEAIADMSEAIRCAPSDPRWYVRRAQMFLLAGDQDAAIASFESAIRLDPESSDAHYGRACALIARGESARAVSEITEAIARRPKAAPLRLARACVYYNLEEFEAAIDDCAEAVRLNPRLPVPYALRAMLEFMLGSFGAANAFAGLALELEPKLPLPHYVRGRVFDAEGKYVEAILEMEQAIVGDSEYLLAIVWRALVEAHRGRYDVAREQLEEAVRNFPGYPDSHLQYAWFLATCPEAAFRNGDKAVAEAQIGVELEHGRPSSLALLAVAYAEAGDFGRAIDLELRAMDETPAHSRDCYLMQVRLYEFRQGIPHRDNLMSD